jgi:hypothetical protein
VLCISIFYFGLIKIVSVVNSRRKKYFYNHIKCKVIYSAIGNVQSGSNEFLILLDLKDFSDFTNKISQKNHVN